MIAIAFVSFCIGAALGWFIVAPLICGMKPFTAPGNVSPERKLGRRS